MNRQMTDLQYFAYENHIKEFVHFTNERNLLSILCRGVLSRKVLQENNIPFEYNDEKRLDGMLDAVSLSVTAPNYLIFYKYSPKMFCNFVQKVLAKNNPITLCFINIGL